MVGIIPVYRVAAIAQPWLMNQFDDEPKRKRPWNPWQYIILAVIAILIAVFMLRPIGVEITSVFQRLTDAFNFGH
jgi:hypothetical protein